MKVQKRAQKDRRQGRIRATVTGTATRPRLAVFRSLQHISAQVIDDQSGRTLVAAGDRQLTGTKTERARQVGTQLAAAATAAGITAVVFDRGGNRYQGRVQALADGARAGGLQF